MRGYVHTWLPARQALQQSVTFANSPHHRHPPSKHSSPLSSSPHSKMRAAAINVRYGLDQLTERQYIKLMERSEAGEDIQLSEDAADVMSCKRRKRKRKGPAAIPIETQFLCDPQMHLYHKIVPKVGVNCATPQTASTSNSLVT